MAHRSPFDDLAFLDPLQSHQFTQVTTLTPTPTQTQVDDPQHPQFDQNQQSHHSNSTSSSSSSSIREQNVDKFATLFAPSTPRGSPVTFPAATLPDEGAIFDQATHVKSHTNAHRRTESTGSEQSDFGVFVSVPSFEDPLSILVDTAQFEEDGLQQLPAPETPSTATAAAYPAVNLPTTAVQTSATTPRFALPPPPAPAGRPASRASSASSMSRSTHSNSAQMNPTLSFFDQFAQDARERSSATRSHLLDELLLHEDDPLYFLKDQKADTGSQNDVTTTSVGGLLSPPLIPLPSTPSSASSSRPLLSSDPPDQSLPTATLLPSSSPQPPNSQSLLDLDLNADLDHDYFRVPLPQANPGTAFKPINSNTNVYPYFARSPPLRSSSIPLPVPTLAPPVSSPEGAVRLESGHHNRSPPAAAHLIDISQHMMDHSDVTAQHRLDSDHLEEGTSSSPSSTTSSRLSLPLRSSSSYQGLSGSLSALPGKWMSTLLRGPQPPTPALDSLFSSGSEASGTATTSDTAQPHPHGHSPPPHNQVLNRRSSTSTSPQRRRNTHSEHYHRQEPTFTHTSAFAPPHPTASTLLSHGASPFAPHVYVPPTGAPGFKGERYTWDKGFSEELAAEAEEERDRLGAGNGAARDLRTGHVKAKTVPVVGKENSNSEREEVVGSSSGSGSGSGWGSGFGFSFGTVRAGKGKVGAGSGSSSASALSPSNSGVGSTSNGNKNGRTRTSSTHSAESGLSEGSWNPQALEHGTDRALNAEFDGDDGQQTGMGVKSRPVDVGVRDARRKDGDQLGNGTDSIGAFIERKSGNVELKGRRAVTTPVLMPEVAGMVRSALHSYPSSRIPFIGTFNHPII
ncbi:hypothetical protein GALMADRAFT_1299973 [Galerina marginata CBS 339.88]|uniref:Uncharacterized protein n=1 Tax=Galerina marginata (strain CBS 339.88) TaxID=685588 RepID=A0A067TGH2_GALM3|nr:hypothetical protein GALMADRAFT_1299973 [Galerina marginata CBS 339.88]